MTPIDITILEQMRALACALHMRYGHSTEHCMDPVHAPQGLKCQHGPEECRLNRIFACAIDLSKTPKEYWPFVECVEGNYGAKIEDSLQGCANDTGFKLKELEDCATGDAL